MMAIYELRSCCGSLDNRVAQTLNPLKTSPEYYLGRGLWEMHVIAKLNRLQRVNCEVPSSNLLAAAVEPLDKALYPHCLVLGEYLKPLVPWLLAYKQLAFLVAR